VILTTPKRKGSQCSPRGSSGTQRCNRSEKVDVAYSCREKGGDAEKDGVGCCGATKKRNKGFDWWEKGTGPPRHQKAKKETGVTKLQGGDEGSTSDLYQ